MKILILSWRDIKHPWKGGAEVYLHEISKNLVKKGHEVTYFGSMHPGGSLVSENIDGVNVIRKGNRFTVYLWAIWYYIFQFRKKFDVIIDQNNGIPFFSPVYVSSTPIICLTHHIFKNQWFKEMFWPLNYIGFWLEKHLIGFAYRHNRFVVVSESTKKDIVDYFGIKEEQIDIVQNAVSSDYQKSCSKTTNPALIYVGRLKKYKRVDFLIRSLLRLFYQFPNLTLHIVGDGEQRDELEDLAARLGIARSVVFHGFVSEKLKMDLLSGAWAFVTASSHEGWGISVIEANACGTLAIGSGIPGLCDSIVDGETGLLFKEDSIYDLSDKIREVLHNPGLRYRLEKQAMVRAKDFSWNNSTVKLLTILQKMVNQGNLISKFKPMNTKILKNSTKPLVSIILPTKYVASFVTPLLDSIAKQSYSNIELIVVDNYSSDATVEIAKKYTKKVFVHGPERNHQRELAVSKARGKYLLFIDSDMTMDGELVADCVWQLEKDKNKVAIILPEMQVGRTKWSLARRLEKEFYMGDESIESPRFFRKTIYKKSGGYDKNLLYAEDMELTDRIRKFGLVGRSRFTVYHNEDRLSWWDIMKKKYKYGKSAKHYFAKCAKNAQEAKNVIENQKEDIAGKKVVNFVKNPWVAVSGGGNVDNKAGMTTKFFRPVFVTKWRKFLDNPVNSVVFLWLRFSELSAMGFGYLFSLVEKENTSEEVKEVREKSA
jgi:glycosyltransferase involved in cell wall biosynthesis